ncbi:unnamed protein product, partial [marine sediment metagenome]
MKITCAKRYIQEASFLNEKTTGRNLSLPILSTILISVQNKSLKLSSTNLETALEILVPAKIEKEGKVAVPADWYKGLISFNDALWQIDIANGSTKMIFGA